MMHFSISVVVLDAGAQLRLKLWTFHRTHLIMSTFSARLMLSVSIHRILCVSLSLSLWCLPVQQTLTLFMVFVSVHTRLDENIHSMAQLTHTHKCTQRQKHAHSRTHSNTNTYVRIQTTHIHSQVVIP